MREMPKFTKAPQRLVEQFESIIKGLGGVTERRMFSYPAAFANGQMFACLFQDKMVLRLPEPDRAAFIREWKTAVFEPTPGRAMHEYAVVPPALVGSPARLSPWIKKSLAYAGSLPPKTRKKRGASRTA